MLKNRVENNFFKPKNGTLNLVKVFTFLIALFAQPIVAQNIKVISEDGSEVDLTNFYSKYDNYDIQSFRIQLLEELQAEGFLSAEIIQVNDSTLQLDKGCAYSMRLTIWPESEKFTMPYNKQSLEQIMRDKLSGLAAVGRMDAKAVIHRLDLIPEECKVEVDAEVQPGDVVYASDVIFEGNRQNSESYLTKISGYHDSMLVSPQGLKELTEKLESSELFESVELAEYVNVDDKATVLIQLQERSLNSFDGLLGYVPDAQGDGQIVGDMELSLWNALSQGNGIELMYKRLRPETSRLEFGVSQKWIGNLPVNLDAGFHFFQNDSTYQSRSQKLGGEYDFRNGLRLKGEIHRQTTTTSRITDIEPGGTLNMAELGFVFSTLNGREIPRQGVYLEAIFGTGSKSLEIDSMKVFPVRTMMVSGRWYLPVFGQSGVAIRSFTQFFMTDYFSDADLYRLGGAKSIRGYAEEQFRASRMVWGDVEYRFHTDASSYLFLFGAIGGYHRPRLVSETDAHFKTTEYLNSFGLGLSYKIRVGRLTFTYALSPQETIGNGKVHVGITTRL